MKRRSWRASLLAIAGFVLFALAWLSVAFVRLEVRARQDAEEGEAVRLALWRMDSWLTAQLSREMTADPGGYASQKPLETTPWVVRYFDSTGAVGQTWPEELDYAAVEERLGILEGELPDWESGAPPEVQVPQQDQAESRQKLLSRSERKKRSQANLQSQWMANGLRPEASPVQVGPLLPLWGPKGTLAFARRGISSGLIQGFLVDWTELQKMLLGEIADLLPKASLEPVLEPEGAQGEDEQLATLPARLIPGPFPLGSSGIGGAALTTLIVSWLSALVALGAVGATLRASERYAERRSRFARTVTHEMRTPLTTFRMYSEMLARDMVEPEKRGEYLETLHRESDRLARLVENVLSYARIEEGRHTPRKETVTVAELFDRVLPTLEAHALAKGALFEWELPNEVRRLSLRTDVDAVGQILFNLLDNACKYGRDERGDCCVRLALRVEADRLKVAVVDQGRGVGAQDQALIFEPFERGVRGQEEPNAGIGLGLALARELARFLDGELVHLPQSKGAGFELELSLHSSYRSV